MNVTTCLFIVHALIYLLPVMGRHLTDMLEQSSRREEYDCFLSHAWDADSKGRNNHERVLQVHTALGAAGVNAWVDKEHLDADLR
jgi:hypothetical protein